MLSLAMETVRKVAQESKESSYRLQCMPLEKRNKALAAIASELKKRKTKIVSANENDLANAEKTGLAKVLLKRLKYDAHKIDESIRSIESLIKQDDPIGKILDSTELDKGLILEKVSCPIGVIAIIFESRPEALVQISTLCIKSGNAVILKGGSEADQTNKALADAIIDSIVSIDRDFDGTVQLLSTREQIKKLLELDDLVDLVIPRGSNELVRSIRESTKIPVLGHSEGICHTYIDEEADVNMAVRVSFDAKCQYPAVCNAMETLLVHKDIASKFLPKMAKKYAYANVEMRGDEKTRRHIKVKPASEKDWSTEYNDFILSIKVVSSLDEAIDHINRYGSHHTDAIITENVLTARKFLDIVDSSSVFWNCSTRFSDGYKYGLGAEVGISTNKTHARGPVGLEGLVIYKYRLYGNGHIVADYSGKDAKKFTHRKLT